MHKFMTAWLFLGLFALNANAEDIYVDLSVLDYLDNNAVVDAPEEPLFPPIAKSRTIVPVKPTPAPKPVPAAKVEKLEPVAPAPVIEIQKQEVEIVETTNADEEKVVIEEVVIAPAPELVTKTEIEPVSEQTITIEPLIPTETFDYSKAVITFPEDISTLTSQDQAKIADTVKHFENAAVNKILILAYNYDNGESIFKKKRLSLNRATEIRSYLLGMGYKNFSIKIVNTDDASQANQAEVSEIK